MAIKINKSNKKSKGKNKLKKKILLGILSLGLIIAMGAAIVGYKFYKIAYQPNICLTEKDSEYLYIPSNATFSDVHQLLIKNNMLKDEHSFLWMAEKKGYMNRVKAGRYLLKNDMSNNDLINLLRSGKQKPIRLTITNIRTRSQLVSLISRQLEADSTQMDSLLQSNKFLKQFDLDSLNSMCLFIPNTYEFYWNTTADKFIQKMHQENQLYWNSNRKQKATSIGLNPKEVVILASIVYEETKKKKEMSRIAGVYINRLNKNMPLQADPTLKFALGDFTLKRILTKHTQIESPYNTYLHAGLPPGPICLVDGYVIDQVLDYEVHNYIFFCAKEDFSGYHNFATTNAEHNENARKYHNALNKLKIK